MSNNPNNQEYIIDDFTKQFTLKKKKFDAELYYEDFKSQEKARNNANETTHDNIQFIYELCKYMNKRKNKKKERQEKREKKRSQRRNKYK